MFNGRASYSVGSKIPTGLDANVTANLDVCISELLENPACMHNGPVEESIGDPIGLGTDKGSYRMAGLLARDLADCSSRVHRGKKRMIRDNI